MLFSEILLKRSEMECNSGQLTAKSDKLPIIFPDIGSMFPSAIANALG